MNIPRNARTLVLATDVAEGLHAMYPGGFGFAFDGVGLDVRVNDDLPRGVVIALDASGTPIERDK